MSWRSPSTSHQLLPRSILLYTVQWHHLRVRTAGIQPKCMYPSHSSSDESVRHLIHTRRNVVLRHSGHHRRHVCSENKQVPVLHLSYPTTGYLPYSGGRDDTVLMALPRRSRECSLATSWEQAATQTHLDL